MLPTILLVFPLVMIYVWLRYINKSDQTKHSPKERCAYCDIAHNIH